MASSIFLGAPYGHSENKFEKFVCTTLVEHSLAVALTTAPDVDLYFENLHNIQYSSLEKKAMVHYHHFPSRDWIPNLIKKGVVKDVTHTLSKKIRPTRSLKIAEAVINRHAWYQKTHPKFLKDFEENFPGELPLKVQLPYVGLFDFFGVDSEALYSDEYKKTLSDFQKKLVVEKDSENQTRFKKEIALFKKNHVKNFSDMNLDLVKNIPHGAIVHVVRPNWNLEKSTGSRLNVSHLGFAIWREERLYFRHASSVHKKVVDEDFVEYFRQYLDSPTIKGFHVLQL